MFWVNNKGMWNKQQEWRNQRVNLSVWRDTHSALGHGLGSVHEESTHTLPTSSFRHDDGAVTDQSLSHLCHFCIFDQHFGFQLCDLSLQSANQKSIMVTHAWQSIVMCVTVILDQNFFCQCLHIITYIRLWVCFSDKWKERKWENKMNHNQMWKYTGNFHFYSCDIKMGQGQCNWHT